MSRAEMYSFADGPGKLCNAMGVSREHDRIDIMGGELFVRDDGWQAEKIICAPRVGIDYAGVAASYPWRFTAGVVDNVPVFTRKQK
jgi:DNA-3-methyladenine glycosylase